MFKFLFGGDEKKPIPVKRIIRAPSQPQKRKAFRIEFPQNAAPVFLKFVHKNRNFRWRIKNISVSGVLIEGQYSYGFFNQDDILTNANIIVPKNKLDIEFSGGFELQIQRMNMTNIYSLDATYALGCAFTKISRTNENNLDKYIRMLQLQNAALRRDEI